MCAINIQHDCSSAGCNTSKQVARQQERLVTTKMKNLVCHLPTNLYVLNTHVLHNYQHIAAVVLAHFCDEGNIPVVDNHDAIRFHGAKLVHAKKPVDLDASVPTTLEGNSVSQEHTAAFDNSNKMRGKGKGRGKEKGRMRMTVKI